MRPGLIAALLLIASGASAQEPERVTVVKDRGLVGLWRIEVPKGIAVTLFRPVKFGPMRPIFCRIEEAGAVHCLNGGFSREGTAREDKDGVHIAWGTAMARFVIDGQRGGDALTGTFTFKFSGIWHEAPVQTRSIRFTGGGEANADTAALFGRLKDNPSLLPPGTAAPGSIEHIAYLGTSPDLDGSGEDVFRVYAIEFSGGERICGLRETGTFTCV